MVASVTSTADAPFWSRERGFVLTPRMWTKIELACIMVLLIDPHLSYLGIEQKNLTEQQNRYVARVCVTRARV